MKALDTVQGLLMLAIGVAALGMDGYALVDAIRQRADAFTAAGKFTKPIWVAILAAATAIGVIYVRYPFGFVNIIAFVAAAIYLADVRPAIKSITGGGGGNGPYGKW